MILTGTHPGSDDILIFTSVGLSMSTTARHLHLKTGQVYYATVRGIVCFFCIFFCFVLFLYCIFFLLNIPVFTQTTTNQFTHSKRGNVTLNTRSSMEYRF